MDDENNEDLKAKIAMTLSSIYLATDKFSNICPVNCHLCEENEDLLFLPVEAEFSSIDIPTGSSVFTCEDNLSCETFENQVCPFLSGTNRCGIYTKRPLDCRSFPIVPRFSLKDKNKVDFFISRKYCPIANKLPEAFVKETMKSWSVLSPLLPSDWKREYNRQNSHSYETRIEVR